MSKKKKTKKRSVSKGTYKPQQVVESPTPAAASSNAKASVAKDAKPAKTESVSVDPRWGYVGRDVKRVGVIGTVSILALIAIWVLFAYTSVDEALYSLIKL